MNNQLDQNQTNKETVSKKRFEPKEWGVDSERELAIEIVVELEKERKRQELSQQALATKAGISQGQLSRIERLENVPDLKTLLKLADALGKKLLIELV